MNTDSPSSSLRASLQYEPVPLKFGTSGRRGKVADLTQLEIYINALAELEYLQSLDRVAGGIVKGDPFYFACDLRPSTTRYVPELEGRGELAQAIVRAIQDAGMQPINLGFMPTPALTFYALEQGKGSIMVTGSHIPFDRNGYKTNSAKGELLKKDESPINERVEAVRRRIYAEPFERSLFDRNGFFKSGHAELPPTIPAARDAYLDRYVRFFGNRSLAGLRLLAYQHSAVGRDLLVEILTKLGAEVIPVGRSDTFVPIDTENIDAEQLDAVRRLALDAWAKSGPFDAVVSTDGDSDRPLILGLEPTAESSSPCRVKFFSGDLVGMVAAIYLGADAVVVPVTCNDAIDRGPLQPILEPKTRIGSPQVIAGLQAAQAKGRRAICGWEPNGGFLTGSDLMKDGRELKALPTRDAMLPILSVLATMKAPQIPMTAVFARLPKRFSKAALLKNFPRPVSHQIIARFTPPEARIKEVVYQPCGFTCRDANGLDLPDSGRFDAREVRKTLAGFFRAADGFGAIEKLNFIDGLRVYFSNGDVAHVRPSGNADELRIYAVADTSPRADRIAALGIAEPDGILRTIANAVGATTEA